MQSWWSFLNNEYFINAASISWGSYEPFLNEILLHFHNYEESINDSTEESINHSTEESINHSTEESINHSTEESICESIDEPICDSINDSTEESICESIDEPICDSINDSTEESICESINEPICDSINDSTEESINEPICDSINDSTEESICDIINEIFFDPIYDDSDSIFDIQPVLSLSDEFMTFFERLYAHLLEASTLYYHSIEYNEVMSFFYYNDSIINIFTFLLFYIFIWIKHTKVLHYLFIIFLLRSAFNRDSRRFIRAVNKKVLIKICDYLPSDYLLLWEKILHKNNNSIIAYIEFIKLLSIKTIKLLYQKAREVYAKACDILDQSKTSIEDWIGRERPIMESFYDRILYFYEDIFFRHTRQTSRVLKLVMAMLKYRRLLRKQWGVRSMIKYLLVQKTFYMERMLFLIVRYCIRLFTLLVVGIFTAIGRYILHIFLLWVHKGGIYHFLLFIFSRTYVSFKRIYTTYFHKSMWYYYIELRNYWVPMLYYTHNFLIVVPIFSYIFAFTRQFYYVSLKFLIADYPDKQDFISYKLFDSFFPYKHKKYESLLLDANTTIKYKLSFIKELCILFFWAPLQVLIAILYILSKKVTNSLHILNIIFFLDIIVSKIFKIFLIFSSFSYIIIFIISCLLFKYIIYIFISIFIINIGISFLKKLIINSSYEILNHFLIVCGLIVYTIMSFIKTIIKFIFRSVFFLLRKLKLFFIFFILYASGATPEILIDFYYYLFYEELHDWLLEICNYFVELFYNPVNWRWVAHYKMVHTMNINDFRWSTKDIIYVEPYYDWTGNWSHLYRNSFIKEKPPDLKGRDEIIETVFMELEEPDEFGDKRIFEWVTGVTEKYFIESGEYYKRVFTTIFHYYKYQFLHNNKNSYHARILGEFNRNYWNENGHFNWHIFIRPSLRYYLTSKTLGVSMSDMIKYYPDAWIVTRIEQNVMKWHLGKDNILTYLSKIREEWHWIRRYYYVFHYVTFCLWIEIFHAWSAEMISNFGLPLAKIYYSYCAYYIQQLYVYKRQILPIIQVPLNNINFFNYLINELLIFKFRLACIYKDIYWIVQQLIIYIINYEENAADSDEWKRIWWAGDEEYIRIFRDRTIHYDNKMDIFGPKDYFNLSYHFFVDVKSLLSKLFWFDYNLPPLNIHYLEDMKKAAVEAAAKAAVDTVIFAPRFQKWRIYTIRLFTYDNDLIPSHIKASIRYSYDELPNISIYKSTIYLHNKFFIYFSKNWGDLFHSYLRWDEGLKKKIVSCKYLMETGIGKHWITFHRNGYIKFESNFGDLLDPSRRIYHDLYSFYRLYLKRAHYYSLGIYKEERYNQLLWVKSYFFIILYVGSLFYFVLLQTGIRTFFFHMTRAENYYYTNGQFLWKHFRSTYSKSNSTWIEEDKNLFDKWANYTPSIMKPLNEWQLLDYETQYVLSRYLKYIWNRNRSFNASIAAEAYKLFAKRLYLHPIRLNQFDIAHEMDFYICKLLFEEKLSIDQKLQFLWAFKEFSKKDPTGTSKFNYQKFIGDPSYSSYFYTRDIESNKLDALIARGVAFSKHLYLLYKYDSTLTPREVYLPADQRANDYYTQFINWIDYLDTLVFKDKGPNWLLNKKRSSFFYSNVTYTQIRGADYLHDCYFFWLFCLPLFIIIKNYIIVLYLFSRAEHTDGSGGQIELLLRTFLMNIKCLYSFNLKYLVTPLYMQGIWNSYSPNAVYNAHSFRGTDQSRFLDILWPLNDYVKIWLSYDNATLGNWTSSYLHRSNRSQSYLSNFHLRWWPDSWVLIIKNKLLCFWDDQCYFTISSPKYYVVQSLLHLFAAISLIYFRNFLLPRTNKDFSKYWSLEYFYSLYLLSHSSILWWKRRLVPWYLEI